jgi:hypothetical protein
MMRAETIFQMDIELHVDGSGNQTRRETVWLTKDQYEVLEIVTRALDQSISEWITGTILAMLECELEETVAWKLRKKLKGIEKDNGKEVI